MCGIAGYISDDDKALDNVISILKTLEYRGYDSAGVGYFKNSANIDVLKVKGKIDTLASKIKAKKLKTNLAIGHTRWATHGVPNEKNSHPHYSNNVVLVHNGIIENYQEIKEHLIQEGYKFYSETDSEVACKLIDFYFEKSKDPIKAIRSACKEFSGSYALAILFQNHDDQIYTISYESSIVVGQNKNFCTLSSDINSLTYYSGQMYILENNEIAILTNNKITFYDEKNQVLKKTPIEVQKNVTKPSIEGYNSFLLKEINEQPKLITKFINNIFIKNKIDYSFLNIDENLKIENIRIIGCGSAYNSGLIGQHFFEKYLKINTESVIASEFRYKEFIKKPNCLNIVISQSGETADTIAALKIAKEYNEKVLAITNNPNSKIAQLADINIDMNCNQEFSVASTKAFTMQCLILQTLAIWINNNLTVYTKVNEKKFVTDLKDNIKKANTIFTDKNIAKIANKIKNAKNVFFLGRLINYFIACEGSLKLKELSYLNCSALPAGELKHGTISLVDEQSVVLGLLAFDDEKIVEKTISNLKETKSRGSLNVLISNKEHYKYLDKDEFLIENYSNNTETSYFNTIFVVQMIAYHVAKKLGRDLDKPRNLAKAVTVE